MEDFSLKHAVLIYHPVSGLDAWALDAQDAQSYIDGVVDECAEMTREGVACRAHELVAGGSTEAEARAQAQAEVEDEDGFDYISIAEAIADGTIDREQLVRILSQDPES
jgi:hypothetical protein